MVVHDGDLRRPGIGPPEYYAPLVVDSDRVEAREATTEFLKTVPRRNGQVTEDVSLIHLD